MSPPRASRRRTSWYVFWTMCCGKRWPPAFVRADSAMSHGKYSLFATFLMQGRRVRNPPKRLGCNRAPKSCRNPLHSRPVHGGEDVNHFSGFVPSRYSAPGQSQRPLAELDSYQSARCPWRLVSPAPSFAASPQWIQARASLSRLPAACKFLPCSGKDADS